MRQALGEERPGQEAGVGEQRVGHVARTDTGHAVEEDREHDLDKNKQQKTREVVVITTCTVDADEKQREQTQMIKPLRASKISCLCRMTVYLINIYMISTVKSNNKNNIIIIQGYRAVELL